MATQSLEFKSGLDDSKFQAGLKNMERGANQSTSKIAGMMKGIGIAALAASAVKGAASIVNFGGELQDMADRTQMNVEAMQGLQGVFLQAGVDREKFSIGVVALNEAMMDAATTADGPARKAFDTLGISFSEINSLQSDEMIYRIGSAMESATNKSAAYSAGITLFGKRNAGMVAVTMQAGDALKKQADAIDRVTAAEIAAVDASGDAATRAKISIQTAATKTAAQIAMASGFKGNQAQDPNRPNRGGGADPRAVEAAKKELEVRRETMKVVKETAEESLKASQAATDAARESLQAALTGQRASRPSLRERRVARMMAELETPAERQTGLRSGGLGGRKLGETIMGSLLSTGKIGDASRSLSSRSGTAKALAELKKAKDKEKQDSANLKASADALKEIERGINGG